jgi:Leucine-rich repeat (LRR) protein
VQFLDLSRNHLTSLGNGLAPFTDLLRLNVSFNAIGAVQQSNFDMLKNLEYLDLAFNSLAGPNAVEMELLNQNPSLLHVYMSNSRITNLPQLFGQQNSNVRVIGFDHNLIENLPDNFFQYIPQVKAVTFRSNLFSNWPVALCNLNQLELLDVAAQNFSSLAFPSSCEPFQSVNRLDLYSNTRMRQLPPNFVQMFPVITQLEMGNCDLQMIPDELSGIKLNRLGMSKGALNKISSGNSDFSGVKRLDIRGSINLKTIGKNDFKSFSGLTTLSMVDCRLTWIDQAAFLELNSLRELNIGKNLLTTPQATWLSSGKLEVLLLYQNPWNCNCSSFVYQQAVASARQAGLRADFIYCSAPAQNDGKRLQSLSQQDLNCGCPNGCSCYNAGTRTGQHFTADCSFAGFTQIPDSGAHPTSQNGGNYLGKQTEILIMKGNALNDDTIQSQVAQLPLLSHLDLAYCGLSKFPNYLNKTNPQLYVLDLASNLIDSIPSRALSGLGNGTEDFLFNDPFFFLNMDNNQGSSGNGLTIANDALAGTYGGALVELQVSNCGLTKIPDFSTNNVRRIYAQGNQITSLSNYKGQVQPNFVGLRVDHNMIKDIDASFFKGMSVLNDVILNDNQLSSLPANLFKDSPKLATLQFNKNNLASVNDNFCTGNTNLNYVSFIENSLPSVPKCLYNQNMQNLQYLRFDDNKITSIDASVSTGNLTSLLYAYFDLNPGLSTIKQNSWLSTSSVTSLHFSGCALTTLPDFICQLSGIFLSKNSLTNADFSACPAPNKLRVLDLSNNQLPTVTFGASFQSEASVLTKLYIDGNKITSLTDADWTGIIASKFMSELHAENNAFTTATPAMIPVQPVMYQELPFPQVWLNPNPFICDCGMNDYRKQYLSDAVQSGYGLNPIEIVANNNTGVVRSTGAAICTNSDGSQARVSEIIALNLGCQPDLSICTSNNGQPPLGVVVCQSDRIVLNDLYSGDLSKVNFPYTITYFETSGANISWSDNTAFQTYTDLSDIHIQGSAGLKTVPAGSFDNLPFLTFLVLDQNQISSLPDNIILNRRQLVQFSAINNQISQISSETFAMNSNSLATLTLSQNKIISFPSRALGSLYGLVNFQADHNMIVQWPEFMSAGQYLQFVDLSYNQIMDPIAPQNDAPYYNLNTLNLNNNQMLNFTVGIAKKIQNVRFLDLSNNNLTRIGARLGGTEFRLMNKINQLNLDNNKFKFVPNLTPLVWRIETLSMQNNNLQPILDSSALGGVVFYRLKSVYFNNNPSLSFIAPFSAFTYSPLLTVLDLTGCGFQYPQAVSIQPYNNLNILEMNGNPLLSLKGAGDTHINGRKLVELDMSDSYPITGGKPGLDYIEFDTFIDCPIVKSLTIRNNGIRNMDYNVFNGTTMLRKLDISYNKMKHPKSGWFIPLTNLTTLNVGHNPWSCDCHSLDFKNYLMTLPQDSSNILYHQFQCNTTQGLMNFEDVDASYYTCGGQPGPTASLQVSIILAVLGVFSFI